MEAVYRKIAQLRRTIRDTQHELDTLESSCRGRIDLEKEYLRSKALDFNVYFPSRSRIASSTKAVRLLLRDGTTRSYVSTGGYQVTLVYRQIAEGLWKQVETQIFPYGHLVGSDSSEDIAFVKHWIQAHDTIHLKTICVPTNGCTFVSSVHKSNAVFASCWKVTDEDKRIIWWRWVLEQNPEYLIVIWPELYDHVTRDLLNVIAAFLG